MKKNNTHHVTTAFVVLLVIFLIVTIVENFQAVTYIMNAFVMAPYVVPVKALCVAGGGSLMVFVMWLQSQSNDGSKTEVEEGSRLQKTPVDNKETTLVTTKTATKTSSEEKSIYPKHKAYDCAGDFD